MRERVDVLEPVRFAHVEMIVGLVFAVLVDPVRSGDRLALHGLRLVCSAYAEILRTTPLPLRTPKCLLRVRGNAPKGDTLSAIAAKSAPHTRRCSVEANLRASRRRVRSAYAEMFRFSFGREWPWCRPLCTHGDVLVVTPHSGNRLQSAPRTWRCSGPLGLRPVVRLVRSAHAEMLRTTSGTRGDRSSPLRACGDAPMDRNQAQIIELSAPLSGDVLASTSSTRL